MIIVWRPMSPYYLRGVAGPHTYTISRIKVRGAFHFTAWRVVSISDEKPGESLGTFHAAAGVAAAKRCCARDLKRRSSSTPGESHAAEKENLPAQ